jgi:hypothetical protein
LPTVYAEPKPESYPFPHNPFFTLVQFLGISLAVHDPKSRQPIHIPDMDCATNNDLGGKYYIFEA